MTVVHLTFHKIDILKAQLSTKYVRTIPKYHNFIIKVIFGYIDVQAIANHIMKDNKSEITYGYFSGNWE